ncbi:STE/STE20/MST protein kinase [Sphaeroforma arctica JP610]|uniref:STE/STE20/MST protein kinase n=1 Tax=Sphaeroforma arctica JP610 TaxID=667725 RepID=A0A0L0F970_9EUKA|nr:STE/STE20/MST protein kinase [Sphaeroforma arctica JP610]KNC73272.1 STE/STE20/MST protein kinase [Sphaeroforma arctica JP610]|eukprot:XP_014147174.1 STE/STE20/MST protein kinase [Sphaeroforma arctica JP610]
MHLRTGVNVAIKKVPADSDMEAIVREITHMHKMEHERVVKYYGSYWTEGTLWIVMEHCAVGSVNDIMSLCQVTLSESQIGCILRDVLIGLEYLHKRNVIHRDLKAANILVTSDGVAKLADFGVSSQLTDELMKRNTVIGTPFWMAPEVIQEVSIP